MKVRFLFWCFTSVLALLCHSLAGQVSNRVGFYLGPQVIIPSAEANGIRYDAGLRFTLGIYHEVALGKHFSIVSEVNYSGLGTRSDIILLDNSGDPMGMAAYSQNLNYGQFPVLFRLRTGGDWLSGHIEAGPYVGMLLTAKARLTDDSGILPDEVTDIRENFESFDWGFKAGIGMDFQPVPHHIFILGLRFAQGLHNVQSATGLQNRAIALQAGYVFRIQ
jgi:hypothetical protein